MFPPSLPGCSPGEHRPHYSSCVPPAARHTPSHGSGLPSLSAFKLPSSKSSHVSGSGSQNSLRSPQEGGAEPPGLGQVTGKCLKDGNPPPAPNLSLLPATLGMATSLALSTALREALHPAERLASPWDNPVLPGHPQGKVVWPGVAPTDPTLIPFPRISPFSPPTLLPRQGKGSYRWPRLRARSHRLPCQQVFKGWGQKYRPGTWGDWVQRGAGLGAPRKLCDA